MRLIMMGTGPFAVPSFRELYNSTHSVELLVTRPPRPIHGKSQADVNPMREVAAERGTPIYEPESINTDEARSMLASHRPDLFVVCDYGQILKPETLAVARLGGINLHASLLPKYRGAAPINWAIFHGETETGVTVLHMTPRIDAGPALLQATTPIGPEENVAELEPRLAAMGAPLVLQAIAELEAGTSRPITQDPALATKAPRLKKTDGAVDWSRPAAAIQRQVRALYAWPKTHTFWHRSSGPALRLILDQVSVLPAPQSAPPGTVLAAAGNQLVIATGNEALQIHRLQPSGKRVLAADEFLRGYPVQSGDRLGPEETSG